MVVDSPILIQTIRNIPSVVGSVDGSRETPMDIEHDSGFPFDDTDFSRDRSFRSQLDDIAKRHPEFAEHLNFDRFPFRTDTKRRGSASASEDSGPSSSSNDQFPERSRFTERPFGSRFERFGFPFTRSYDDEPPQFQKEPPSKPETHTHPPQQEEPTPKAAEKPPPVPHQDRGRKQNPNIPQSNTVDLGQKQVPVDDSRGQRSMSAPPENRSGQQRYVSSINIPINAEGPDMGGRQSKPTQWQHQPKPEQPQRPSAGPNERVIPIHVEGRDEPVLPRNINQTFSTPPPQQERVFGQRPAPFGQWNRGEPQYYRSEPQQQPQKPTPEEIYKQQQQQYQKQQQQNFEQQQQQKEHQSTPTPPPQPEAAAGPIGQIQIIQKEVLELMNQVENFSGKPKDKQYLYLDEMLTRNLLKLDNIETEGKEPIRQARKGAIKCIEKCINILEAKAAANDQMEQAKAESDVNDTTAPVSILEVSGTARPGKAVSSEVSQNQASDAVTPMDVTEATTELKVLEETPKVEIANEPVEVMEVSAESEKEKNNTQVEASNSSQSCTNPAEGNTEVKPDKKKVKKKEKAASKNE